MSRLPYSKRTENFSMRITKELKDKLNNLAKRQLFGGSASSAIRYMINYHSR